MVSRHSDLLILIAYVPWTLINFLKEIKPSRIDHQINENPPSLTHSTVEKRPTPTHANNTNDRVIYKWRSFWRAFESVSTLVLGVPWLCADVWIVGKSFVIVCNGGSWINPKYKRGEIRKQQVNGSNPFGGSIIYCPKFYSLRYDAYLIVMMYNLFMHKMFKCCCCSQEGGLTRFPLATRIAV